MEFVPAFPATLYRSRSLEAIGPRDGYAEVARKGFIARRVVEDCRAWIQYTARQRRSGPRTAFSVEKSRRVAMMLQTALSVLQSADYAIMRLRAAARQARAVR